MIAISVLNRTIYDCNRVQKGPKLYYMIANYVEIRPRVTRLRFLNESRENKFLMITSSGTCSSKSGIHKDGTIDSWTKMRILQKSQFVPLTDPVTPDQIISNVWRFFVFIDFNEQGLHMPDDKYTWNIYRCSNDFNKSENFENQIPLSVLNPWLRFMLNVTVLKF